MTASNGRREWVDTAKGLGILLVVYTHVRQGIASAGLAEGAAADLAQAADAVIFTFRMPLFFLLSGLFFARTLEKHGPGRLTATKAAALLVPAGVWGAFQGAAQIAAGAAANSAPPVSTVLWAPLWPVGQFWFLQSLFLMFAATAAVWTAVGKNAGRWVAVAAAVAVAVFPPATWLPAGSWLGQAAGTNFLSISSTGEYLIYFAIGAAAGEPAMRRLVRSRRAVVMAAAAFAAGTVALVRPDAMTDRLPVVWAMPLAVCGLTAAGGWAAAAASTRLGRGISAAGRVSFAIFVLHVIAAAGVRAVLLKAGVRDFPVHLAAGLVAGVAIPWIAEATLRKVGRGWVLSPPRLPRPAVAAA